MRHPSDMNCRIHCGSLSRLSARLYLVRVRVRVRVRARVRVRVRVRARVRVRVGAAVPLVAEDHKAVVGLAADHTARTLRRLPDGVEGEEAEV